LNSIDNDIRVMTFSDVMQGRGLCSECGRKLSYGNSEIVGEYSISCGYCCWSKEIKTPMIGPIIEEEKDDISIGYAQVYVVTNEPKTFTFGIFSSLDKAGDWMVERNSKDRSFYRHKPVCTVWDVNEELVKVQTAMYFAT